MREFRKLKYLVQLPVTTGASEAAQDYNVSELRYIRISDFDENGNVREENKVSIPTSKGEKYLLEDNDILAAVTGGTVGKALIFHPIDGNPACYAGYLARIRTNELLSTQYLYYYMLSPLFDDFKAKNITKSTMENISASKYHNMPVLWCDVDIQEKIVTELDSVFTKVNTLEDNQRRQIEKLLAYKQAIISRTVLKGLDPTVPMKDSGVEWIGEIPAHWEIQRGKAFLHETNERSTDGSEELLTVSHITGITPRSQKNVNMFMSETLEGYKICRIGDVASNTMWMWQGAIGVSEYHGVISPSYNTYRQRANQYNPKYLDYLLRIPSMVEAYTAYSTGITASRLRLYPQPFLSLPFVLPPIEEQECIVEKLGKECDYIDRLIAIKQSKIEKLNEYKKSLIYEYVTGKKEVTG